MRRICNSTAIGTRPSPAAVAVSPGYFQEGDGSSTQGTILDNDWLNTIQEEMIAILAAAGITIDTTGNTNNQVLAAIQALIAAAQGNLSAFDTYTGNQTFGASDFGKGKRLSAGATADVTFSFATLPTNGKVEPLENGSPTHNLTIQADGTSIYYGFLGASGWTPVGSPAASFTMPPNSTAWKIGTRNGNWLVFFNSASFDPAGTALTMAGNGNAYKVIADANYEIVAADFGKTVALSGPTATRAFTLDDGTGIAAGQARLRIVSISGAFPLTIKIKTGSSATFVSPLAIPVNGSTSFQITAAEVFLEWAAGNWRVGYASSAFVQLANQLGVMTAASATGVTIGASYSDTVSVTFTAPSNGSVYASGKINLGAVGAHNVRSTLKIGATVIEADNTPLSQAYHGGKAVSAGDSVTVSIIVTTTTDPAVVGTYSVAAIFIPTS